MAQDRTRVRRNGRYRRGPILAQTPRTRARRRAKAVYRRQRVSFAGDWRRSSSCVVTVGAVSGTEGRRFDSCRARLPKALLTQGFRRVRGKRGTGPRHGRIVASAAKEQRRSGCVVCRPLLRSRRAADGRGPAALQRMQGRPEAFRMRRAAERPFLPRGCRSVAQSLPGGRRPPRGAASRYWGRWSVGREAERDVRVRDVRDLAMGALVVAGAARDREAIRRWILVGEILQELNRKVAVGPFVGHDAVPELREAYAMADSTLEAELRAGLQEGGFETPARRRRRLPGRPGRDSR